MENKVKDTLGNVKNALEKAKDTLPFQRKV